MGEPPGPHVRTRRQMGSHRERAARTVDLWVTEAYCVTADDVLVIEQPPDHFFKALGRLVYEFSHLDGALDDDLLTVQVRPDRPGLVEHITTGETTEWLRNKCMALL